VKRRDSGYLGVDREGCFFSLTATGQTLPIIVVTTALHWSRAVASRPGHARA